ncbi:5-formyltetrahydrofolate cyclo-ligase [uncultured Tenacibaculum sp.]|uniref:5-formyltetrahydrofolate cyclo-ligase n=1 Tax=uncultured Tenacibaculum sp. TaxID=174713 RepID=UPI0026283FF1|nr:5-formyltetrahydrofolate cyclo-ligase [uncultured Tenacibaculum sp.]
MNKNELRKIYKQKRKDLSFESIENLQKSIYNQIYNFDFSKVQNIHIFLPIEKQKEINTYPIVSYLRSINKNIIISKSDFSNATLTHYFFEEDTILVINQYGIPEPENALEINVKEIDLVFVPLLISDEKKYRVGYGKGFYDRFLSDCKTTVQTIGLNFFAPITSINNLNEFDVPLDKVIYPEVE